MRYGLSLSALFLLSLALGGLARAKPADPQTLGEVVKARRASRCALEGNWKLRLKQTAKTCSFNLHSNLEAIRIPRGTSAFKTEDGSFEVSSLNSDEATCAFEVKRSYMEAVAGSSFEEQYVYRLRQKDQAIWGEGYYRNDDRDCTIYFIVEGSRE